MKKQINLLQSLKTAFSTSAGDQPVAAAFAARKSVFWVALLFAMSASVAVALTIPTAGIGFGFYTVVYNLYSTGIGYVVAFVMFAWGCIDFVKNWKEGLAWAAGGVGVASIPALVNAAGLTL